MKLLYWLLFLIVIAACKKNTDSDQDNTTASCFSMKTIPTNLQEPLTSVFFLDGKDGFASGYLGGLYKTTDSAKTWTALPSPVSIPVRCLYFSDALHGIAVGGENSCSGTGCTVNGGFILRTVDGGQNWSTVHTPSDKIEVSSVYFLNDQIGFCAGDNIIFKTTDGGATWNEYKVNNLGGKMMQIFFVSPQKGYVVCMFDKILKTENGGISWDLTSPMRNLGYYSVSGTETATYVSGQGKIIKSSNGGNTWTELSNSPADIFALHFTNNKKGFAFGRGNYSGGDFGLSYAAIYCTNNGGISWNGTADQKETGVILSVSFPTADLGYGASGYKVTRFTIN